MQKTKRNKLNGFTVIELVVTMIILGIVIGAVYYMFVSFNQRFLQFEKEQIGMSETLMFQEVFERDLYLCDQVILENENFIMRDKQLDKKYEFSQGKIVRHAVTIDTFDVVISKPTLTLEDNGDLFFDVISFDVELNARAVKMHFNKRRQKDQMINDLFLNEY